MCPETENVTLKIKERQRDTNKISSYVEKKYFLKKKKKERRRRNSARTDQ